MPLTDSKGFHQLLSTKVYSRESCATVSCRS